VRERGATVYDREAAIVLRAVETGARDMRTTGGGDTAYLSLMSRLLQVTRAARPVGAPAGAGKAAGSIIIP
jgi:hypothetical protein